MSRYKLHFEIAVLVSLLLHIVAIDGWEQRAIIARLPFFGKLAKTFTAHPPSAIAKLIPEKQTEPVITFVEEPEPPRATRSRPLQFIETDQSQVSGEKPTDSNFYSDRSTVAANPANPTGKTGDTPYLDGNETRMTSTADVVPKPGPGGIPLPPGQSHPAIRATPPSPAAPAAGAAGPAPLAPMVNTKSAAPSPLLKPLPEEFNKPPTPEKTELAKNDTETKPEVKSKEKKPTDSGGVEKGTALEKPKSLSEEAWKAKEPEKLAMLTPPPQPKTVPTPPLPLEETPSGKPELSLRQPATAAAPSPLLTATATPASPGSPGVAATMGGGTGSAGSGSSREIAARKTKGTTVGVNRVGVAAFNVAESPFGAYDKQVVRAVQSRWYALIEQNGLYERAGEVTVHFKLMPDGSVADADVKTSTAGQILALFCQKAVVESAPFEPWPEELRTYLGNEPREVDFTFYY